MPLAHHSSPVPDARSAETFDGSWKLSVWLMWIIAGVLCIGLVGYEMRTSALQAQLLPHLVSKFSYTVQAGPSPAIAYPQAGPFDARFGYTVQPSFQHRLKVQGYAIEHQARLSPALAA